MISSIDAAPAPKQPQTVLIQREVGNVLAPTTIGVYFCLEPFWKGACEYLENGPGLCSKQTQSELHNDH